MSFIYGMKINQEHIQNIIMSPEFTDFLHKSNLTKQNLVNK